VLVGQLELLEKSFTTSNCILIWSAICRIFLVDNFFFVSEAEEKSMELLINGFYPMNWQTISSMNDCKAVICEGNGRKANKRENSQNVNVSVYTTKQNND